MAFIDRLKEARLYNEMTQEQLAEKIGVAKSTYTGYEKGNSEPSMLTISKLMNVLKVDANFLWQDEMDALGGNPVKLKYNEMKHIEKYRDLDPHGKEMVDFTLHKEWERSISIKKIQEDKVVYYHKPTTSITSMVAEDITPYGVDAANKRTDIEVPKGTDTSDSDIMDAEDF